MAGARESDVYVSTGDSWVPPVEEELVRAARASRLRQRYPFTSHNHLCFTDGPMILTPGAEEFRVLPGSVSFDKGGIGGSPVLRVWRGKLMGTPGPVLAAGASPRGRGLHRSSTSPTPRCASP